MANTAICDALDRRRDRLRLVLGLLGHVRDRLDAGVGDHADRDREQEVAPRRRDAEHDVVDERFGREHEEEPREHEQHLGQEVDDGERDVQPGRLLGAEDVDGAQQDDDADAEEDVAGALLEELDRLEQAAEVVRDEERRDRDGDDVVEHLRPRREERPELVERAPREARRAARLGVHRRRLGVRRGGAEEDRAGDQEDQRRQAEREARDQAQRVVDRRADVAVGGREEGVDAQDALETVQATLGHARHGSLTGCRQCSVKIALSSIKIV